MNKMHIEASLLGFVADELLEGDPTDLDAKTPLLELGIIDSMSIVALIAFVESECGVTIPSERVRPEHFKDVASIVRLVRDLSHAEGDAP